jgi:hypothetical protein
MKIDHLSAKEIDKLIFRLAQRRSEISPTVPMMLKADTTIHSQENPAMSIAPNHESNGIHLVLSCGGLGWIDFGISYTNSIALRDWLINRYGLEGKSIFSKS